MANGAILISNLRLIVESRRTRCVDLVADRTMTFQTKLPDRTAVEHLWIGGTMRRMASGTTLGLKRSMFKCEWPLLIVVALDARCIGTDRQRSLLCLKTAVSVMTAGAFHRALHHFVMERLCKLRLRFRVATHTKLRLALFEHSHGSNTWILFCCLAGECDRICM